MKGQTYRRLLARDCLLVAFAVATTAGALSVKQQSSLGLASHRIAQELAVEEDRDDAVRELTNEKAHWSVAAAHASDEEPMVAGKGAAGVGLHNNSGETSESSSRTEEFENHQLHNMLDMANGYEQKLEGQLTQLPLLKRQVATEQDREKQLAEQLYNTKAYAASLNTSVQQLQNNNSMLMEVVRNMTSARIALQAELRKSDTKRKDTEVAFSNLRRRDEAALAAAVESENNLSQGLKKAQEEVMQSRRDTTATHTALQRLDRVQHDLNATQRKFDDEVAKEHQANEASKSALDKLSAKNQRLAEEVEFLKRRVADGDAKRKHDLEVAGRFALEAQQNLTRNARELNASAREVQTAYEARDVATAMLDEAKRKIVHLEQKYASVVQSLDREESLDRTRSTSNADDADTDSPNTPSNSTQTSDGAEVQVHTDTPPNSTETSDGVEVQVHTDTPPNSTETSDGAEVQVHTDTPPNSTETETNDGAEVAAYGDDNGGEVSDAAASDGANSQSSD